MADIIRRWGPAYIQSRQGKLRPEEQPALRALAACRTSVLGGHVDRCDHCGHEEYVYHGCGNRHCPKCQASERAAWLDARSGELLPVEYFHVVFTLPAPLEELAWANRKLLYSLLFSKSAETLREAAANPAHLGAEIGVLAVLHTWGQNLHHHPHVHCIVPGGGFSPDRQRWVSCPRGFFIRVEVLSRLFRGKFLAAIRELYDSRQLYLPAELKHLADRREFNRWLSTLYRTEWVVHAKPPFGGAEQALKYLARYTHRVAISNQRLSSLEDDRVAFRWKDYASGGKWRTMRLDAVEFLRRFSMHILPKGFVRIRYYGFLANSCRSKNLQQARRLLNADAPTGAGEPDAEVDTSPAPAEPTPCPVCGVGRMSRVAEYPRPRLAELLAMPWPFDTS